MTQEPDVEFNATAEQSLLSSFRDEASFQGTVDDESDLEPSFHDSSKRKMTIFGAVSTLLASMLGGGMLTLPYATSKVGIGGSLIISLLCAGISEVTYRFLIESARATKRSSYQAIGEDMLGSFGRILSMISVILLTLFASMGYLLLLGLLVGEVVKTGDDTPSRSDKNLISIIFAVLLLPMSASQNLYALRYANAFSVGAAAFLLLAVIYESGKDGEGFHKSRRMRTGDEILWFTDDISNVVYAVPFYIGAYMAHFSLLSVHAELIKPSRERVGKVLRSTVVVAWILYSALGILGYLYALDNTCDSVFSNLPRDWLTSLGRLGLVTTLSLSYPLFIVPCRSTICDLVTRYYEDQGLEDDEKVLLVERLQSTKIRFLLTLIIVSCSTFLACVIPSAALFVSLTGSSVGTILALILPSLFYVRLPRDARGGCSTAVAVFLLLLGLIVLCVCTWSSISHANDDPCDAQKRL